MDVGVDTEAHTGAGSGAGGGAAPPIDFRSLEVFYWVVKLGGFGRAAERLRMTQPAVSARIGQAEHGFRARLLDRSSHRAPVPTPKGRELFHYAERMLALRGEMLTRLGHAGEMSGVLRLGVAETLVHTLLGALVRRLHALHPAVTPEIVVDTSPNMAAALMAGEIDLALMLGPPGAPGVAGVPLGECPLVWVASPDLALGGEGAGGAGEGRRLTLADLARWPILSYARGTLPNARLAELFARAGLPEARLFANASLSSMLRMALDGIGIGAMPRAVIGRELGEGSLRLLDVEPPLEPLCFSACFLPGPTGGLARAVAELAGTIAREA